MKRLIAFFIAIVLTGLAVQASEIKTATKQAVPQKSTAQAAQKSTTQPKTAPANPTATTNNAKSSPKPSLQTKPATTASKTTKPTAKQQTPAKTTTSNPTQKKITEKQTPPEPKSAITITKVKNKIKQIKAEEAGIVEAVVTITNNTSDNVILEDLDITNTTQNYEAYDECRYSYFEIFKGPRKFKKEYYPVNKELKKIFAEYKSPINPFTKFKPVTLQPGETYITKKLIKGFYQPKISMKAINETTKEIYQHKDN